jgi:hypothetical protein
MNISDHRVKHHHGQDHTGVHIFLQQHGNDAGYDQDVDQRTGELVKKDLQLADFFLSGEQVGTVFGKAFFGLFVSQALLGGLQFSEYLFDVKLIPNHLQPPG